ncbi:MAG: class II fumarate hydratase [Alphaproteobacteria bacterium]|nr:class II fumarate hydratase [Alphaproteobacteria bacterium]
MTGPKRIETDSLGTVQVPARAYWGAQTQGALENFKIGHERMPAALIRALGLQKLAAARANIALGALDPALGEVIVAAAEDVAAGRLMEHFPLSVWQTGSGTQTHMNVNEVIASRANQRLTGQRGGTTPVHPNDHVNLGQSSNDSVPTAMHVAALMEIEDRLLPALGTLHDSLAAKAGEFHDVVKIGRTHLQDAAPLTLGQEIGAWAHQVTRAMNLVRTTLPPLLDIPQGGTAVGTGLNTRAGFADAFARELAQATGKPFRPAANKFALLAAHDALVATSGALNGLAATLMKIANDVCLLASGPRAGLGELILPENEPGSSIMPGKINPTQAEALAMVAAQVMGNHVTITITIAGSHGALQLNVFKPVLIHNLLQSVVLLADAAASFARHCVDGLGANRDRIAHNLSQSLMLVTALSPHIGYDRAAEVALKAHREGLTLEAAALALGVATPEQLRLWLRPETMLGPMA